MLPLRKKFNIDCKEKRLKIKNKNKKLKSVQNGSSDWSFPKSYKLFKIPSLKLGLTIVVGDKKK